MRTVKKIQALLETIVWIIAGIVMIYTIAVKCDCQTQHRINHSVSQNSSPFGIEFRRLAEFAIKKSDRKSVV